MPHVIKLAGLKPTFKGKGKLGESQRPLQTYVLSSSSETNPVFGVTPTNHLPSKKPKASLINPFLVKNTANSQITTVDGAIRQGSQDKVNQLHLDLINDVSACGNFVQHDLEDVSVSSDFVNQLNDEHSLELNLEYGSENISHQILLKTSTSDSATSNPNFNIDCGMVQPALDNFGNLMPPTPTPEANTCAHSESVCHMSVAEDDFSSEENDYISNAVLLSMQEDDFSILNCDQSPFQGTLSVVDENSQSDKMNTLDDGVPVILTSEENLMNREHVFYSGGTGSNNKCSKGNNSLLMPMIVAEQNTIRYQSENCVQQEMCYMSSQSINKDLIVSDKEEEEVFCFSSLAEEENAAEAQDLLHMSSVHNVPTNQLLSSPIDQCPMDKQELSLSSSVDGNAMADSGSVFQISSSGGISPVENQDLFQISSSCDVNEYVTNQDVFLTSSSNNGNSLSSTCFSGSEAEQDPPNLIISGSCSPDQNVSSVSNMYFLPCLLECKSISDFGNNSDLPQNGSTPSVEDSTMQLCSLDSQVMSLPGGTNANADSTTVLLRSSPSHLHADHSTRLITLTSPNTYVIRNAPAQVLSLNTEETEVSMLNTIPSSENIFLYSGTDQDQSSTSPLNCESTKENGFAAAYDLQLVESVLSEQDDAPRNPFKAVSHDKK